MPAKEIEVNSGDADGLVLYLLANRGAPKSLPAKTNDGRPLVVVWSPYGEEVKEAALDFRCSAGRPCGRTRARTGRGGKTRGATSG